MMRNKKNQGFTLIELSMVLAIIAILIGAIASSSTIVKRANLAAARQMTANSPVSHIDGLALWLETSLKDSVNYNSSKYVTQWNDISGNGRDLTNDTGNATFVNEGDILGGVPVINFNGTTEVSLSYSEPISSSKYTVFMAVYLNDNANDQDLFYNGYDASGGDGWGIERDSGNSVRVIHDTDESGDDLGQNDSIGIIITARWDGTTTEGKIDNDSFSTMSLISGPDFPSSSSGEIKVGGTNMTNAEIAEIIVYDRDLFDSEVNDVVEYLMQKYNL